MFLTIYYLFVYEYLNGTVYLEALLREALACRELT